VFYRRDLYNLYIISYFIDNMCNPAMSLLKQQNLPAYLLVVLRECELQFLG